MKNRISPAEIHLAVSTNQPQLVDRLLSIGADPDARYRGVTLLGLATSSLDRSMVKKLLNAGADPNSKSQGLNGRIEPPIYTAARLRDEELVELFISSGADVNATDFYGHNALWVATKGQRPLLMAKLLEGGSCVGSHDWSQCPLYLTTKYLGYRGRCQLSKFLVTAGSDPTTMDPDGKSSLYWSLRNRDYDLFRFMIDSCNPRCWAVLMDRNIEDLLGNMPEELLLFLQNQWYNPVSLAAQCRLVIRTHLLKISGNRSLFLRVPSLPLPARLIRFLLLEQQPPQEETIPCFMKNTSVKKSRD